MRYVYNRRNRRRLSRICFVIVVAVVVAVAIGGFVYYYSLHPIKKVKTAASVSATETSATKPVNVAGRYLLNGTITWARATDRDAVDANGQPDYNQPFSQLNTFNRNQYDAWSTDFECPITSNNVPYSVQASDTTFNCRPEFLPAAAKYFNFFDLANNHTDNQGGMTGLQSTRNYLSKQPGVQYFGNFDPSITADTCEVIALPVRIIYSNQVPKKSALPVAFCAWEYVLRDPLPGEIAAMKKYAQAMPVFAFAEMGVEDEAHSDATQQVIAHEIIDQGSQFLIANNPHWVQNTEAYKGKLIVYSTGNFIFDQLEPEQQRSASIDLGMTVPYSANVAKWLKLAPSCAVFHDNCLQKAQQEGLKKINLNLKFAVVAGQGGDRKITHRADASTQAAVERRMNWTQTCQKLTTDSC
ncbi:MAG: CapA family protein [Candidatus Saccharimonadales bacterium]